MTGVANPRQVEARKQLWPRDTRVKLVTCEDEHSNMRPGELGTVRFVDSMGTIHIDWDSGSRLGIVPEAGDSITRV